MPRLTAPMAALLLFALCAPLLAETYHVDPAKGSEDGDGSAAKPWKTLAEVAKAKQLATLKGGDTVLLASGYHGDVALAGDNASTITIAADKGAKPQLSRLTIKSGSNWLVKGLIISPSFGEASYTTAIVTFGENGESSKISVEDCYIFNVEDASGWDAKEWMAAKSGMLVGRNGRDLTARNNYIRNVRFGITMTSFDSVCEGNVIENFSADAIRVTRDGQVAQYNVIRNVYVSDKDGDDNHDDGIQAFLFNKGKGELKNITINGNIIIAHDSPNQKLPNTLQGIGFFDGPLVDFKVTDNVVNVDAYHGISLYDAQNAVIERNVVWSGPGAANKAWIMYGSKPKQASPGKNVARDNYSNKFTFKIPGITEENNKPSTEAIYKKALDAAYKTICDKFGEQHVAAERSRMGK